MALASSYVAQTTQISFHYLLTPLDWDRVNNVFWSGSRDVDVEAGAGVP